MSNDTPDTIPSLVGAPPGVYRATSGERYFASWVAELGADGRLRWMGRHGWGGWLCPNAGDLVKVDAARGPWVPETKPVAVYERALDAPVGTFLRDRDGDIWARVRGGVMVCTRDRGRSMAAMAVPHPRPPGGWGPWTVVPETPDLVTPDLVDFVRRMVDRSREPVAERKPPERNVIAERRDEVIEVHVQMPPGLSDEVREAQRVLAAEFGGRARVVWATMVPPREPRLFVEVPDLSWWLSLGHNFVDGEHEASVENLRRVVRLALQRAPRG